MSSVREDMRYLRTGFPSTFREALAWSQRPGRWYWLPLTVWFYPFLAMIHLTVQAHDWNVEARQRKEAPHGNRQ